MWGPAVSERRHLNVGVSRVGLALSAIVLASCAAVPTPPTSANQVPEVWKGTGFLAGYLSPAEAPRSDRFLPGAPETPPLPGSDDDRAARQAFARRDQPRWALAARDADLRFPSAARVFACALGFEPSESRTPHLMMLLRRTMADAGLSTRGVKEKYRRPRPFVVLKEQSCTPGDEAFLAKDGSYPSGHAAAGWAWALVLAELAPARKDAFLRRGVAFGQSRVDCGVHWQSDVDAGRVVGAAAVAALRDNAAFRRQAELARAEIAAMDRSPLRPAMSYCAAEESVLSGF